MANRQDSGSSSAHQNQQPTGHNEDALPEMTDTRAADDTRNRSEEDDDEFEDEDTEDLEEGSDDDEEGSF